MSSMSLVVLDPDLALSAAGRSVNGGGISRPCYATAATARPNITPSDGEGRRCSPIFCSTPNETRFDPMSTEALFDRPMYWRLDGHTPIPITLDDLSHEWERRRAEIAKGEDPWRVAYTELSDSVYVSTVFLSIDHQYGDGPPILFETMVFGLPDDHPLNGWQQRCSTWEQAEKQHQSIVEMVTVDGAR